MKVPYLETGLDIGKEVAYFEIGLDIGNKVGDVQIEDVQIE